MSSSSTFTRFSSRLVRQAARIASCFSLACFSLSRMAAAPSKSCSLMAFSLRVLISIFMVFVLSVPMIVYGVRRYQDVSREMNARIRAELEARNLALHDP